MAQSSHVGVQYCFMTRTHTPCLTAKGWQDSKPANDLGYILHLPPCICRQGLCVLQHHPHLADKPIAYDLVSKLHGCRCVRVHVDNIAPTEIQAAPTVGASGWWLCLLLLESCLLRLRILLWGLSSRLSRERLWLLEVILWSWLRWVSTPLLLLLLRWVRTPLLLVIRITCWWRPKGVGRQPLASHGACNKSTTWIPPEHYPMWSPQASRETCSVVESHCILNYYLHFGVAS